MLSNWPKAKNIMYHIENVADKSYLFFSTSFKWKQSKTWIIFLKMVWNRTIQWSLHCYGKFKNLPHGNGGINIIPGFPLSQVLNSTGYTLRNKLWIVNAGVSTHYRADKNFLEFFSITLFKNGSKFIYSCILWIVKAAVSVFTETFT